MGENIIIFGASIAFGACDTENRGWAGRLGNYVEKKTKWDMMVYNMGVSGDTSEDVLKRFEFECDQRRKPEIIIITVGANDSQYIERPGNYHVPPERFRENMGKLLDAAKGKAPKVMFLGLMPVDESKTMPIPWKTDTYYTNENISRYDTIAREVCSEKGVPFLGLLDVFRRATEEFFHDGLHPTSEGHQRVFEKVKQFLEDKGWI